MDDVIAKLIKATGAAGTPSSDFDLNPDVRPKNRALKPAAVLIAFMENGSGIDLVLTKRSSALKHHPGQIAFPGGKVDPDDDGPIAAALREAEEEIGLPRTLVEVIGTLPQHETVTGFEIVPVVARVKARFTAVAEKGEVAEIFHVPFDHIASAKNYIEEGRYFRGQYRKYFVVPFGPYYIWGATARILRVLADRMEA